MKFNWTDVPHRSSYQLQIETNTQMVGLSATLQGAVYIYSIRICSWRATANGSRHLCLLTIRPERKAQGAQTG